MKSLAAISSFICLLACSNFAAFAADTKVDPEVELAKICEHALCRTPKVSLYIDSEHRFEHEGKAPFPVLQNNLVVIYPGEKLFVEAAVVDGRIKLERAVSSNQLPDRTIEFSFFQTPNKPNMVLIVKNPLPVTVKFQMALMRPDSEALQKTSSCPVLSAGRSIYEGWPYPIFQLVMMDVSIPPPSDRMVCD